MKIRILIFSVLVTGLMTLCTKDVDQGRPAVKKVDNILLKDFRPKSIYNIPKTEITHAKYPIIDMHSHQYAKTPEEVNQWVKIMDDVGIEKTIVLATTTGTKFDSVAQMYSKYPDRFELWCGLDYTGYDQSGFGPAAVAELERCYKSGARGVGELGDKGKGLFYSEPGPKAWDMHPDDPRMDMIWEKCAELNMPVNLHVADPIWMYLPMDSTNDGMMNAIEWRLDDQPGIVDNPGMLKILENTVKKHPNTTFIACHFANQSHDLNALGKLFDQYPNLYADISARFAETSTIPRFTGRFYEKYQDRLLYGTDMGFRKEMYKVTLRVLETADEHFYEMDLSGYHWAFNGLDISDEVLKKLYRDNALKILSQ